MYHGKVRPKKTNAPNNAVARFFLDLNKGWILVASIRIAADQPISVYVKTRAANAAQVKGKRANLFADLRDK